MPRHCMELLGIAGALLANAGHCWLLLGIAGYCWALLALGCFGLLWVSLGCLGLLRAALDCCGLLAGTFLFSFAFRFTAKSGLMVTWAATQSLFFGYIFDSRFGDFCDHFGLIWAHFGYFFSVFWCPLPVRKKDRKSVENWCLSSLISAIWLQRGAKSHKMQASRKSQKKHPKIIKNELPNHLKCDKIECQKETWNLAPKSIKNIKKWAHFGLHFGIKNGTFACQMHREGQDSPQRLKMLKKDAQRSPKLTKNREKITKNEEKMVSDGGKIYKISIQTCIDSFNVSL